MLISPSNDKIKYIKKLSKRQQREKSGEFIIEGKRSVLDAIENGADISYIIAREGCDTTFPNDIKVFETDNKTFMDITDTESPQDMLAVAKMISSDLKDLLNSDLIVYCDSVQDPGNLGTIIRTADGRGNASVILSKGSVDLFNPKVVRSTMSSIFNIPILKDAIASELFPLLKDAGYKILCGALKDESEDLFSIDLKGKWVIVIGNEANGASDYVIDSSDKLCMIPMNGKAESLNAAISGGIMMYEHLRQNR